MGISKEQLYEKQEDAFCEDMAEYLGITCDEVEELEPKINESTGSDGAMYGYYLTFKEGAPRKILDKIKGLDFNDRFWLDISEVCDEDYDEEQYKYIIKKRSPYKDCLASIEDAMQLMNIPLKKNMKLKQILYRQIYASLISIMEVYLCERLLLSIDKNENLLANFFLSYNGAHNFNEHDIKKVRKYLMEDILYHNINKVSKIYKDTFNFPLPSWQKIKNAIELRHDIIHRNGKKINGSPLFISRKNIEHLSKDIKEFIFKIECNNSSSLFPE